MLAFGQQLLETARGLDGLWDSKGDVAFGLALVAAVQLVQLQRHGIVARAHPLDQREGGVKLFGRHKGIQQRDVRRPELCVCAVKLIAHCLNGTPKRLGRAEHHGRAVVGLGHLNWTERRRQGKKEWGVRTTRRRL